MIWCGGGGFVERGGSIAWGGMLAASWLAGGTPVTACLQALDLIQRQHARAHGPHTIALISPAAAATAVPQQLALPAAWWRRAWRRRHTRHGKLCGAVLVLSPVGGLVYGQVHRVDAVAALLGEHRPAGAAAPHGGWVCPRFSTTTHQAGLPVQLPAWSAPPAVPNICHVDAPAPDQDSNGCRAGHGVVEISSMTLQHQHTSGDRGLVTPAGAQCAGHTQHRERASPCMSQGGGGGVSMPGEDSQHPASPMLRSSTLHARHLKPRRRRGAAPTWTLVVTMALWNASSGLAAKCPDLNKFSGTCRRTAAALEAAVLCCGAACTSGVHTAAVPSDHAGGGQSPVPHCTLSRANCAHCVPNSPCPSNTPNRACNQAWCSIVWRTRPQTRSGHAAGLRAHGAARHTACLVPIARQVGVNAEGILVGLVR